VPRWQRVVAMKQRVCFAAAAIAAAGTGANRWARRTRATREEKTKALAGDELVPDPMWAATRAITISAAPADVWPWLVQMGFPTHRAGWYTPYWLDRTLFGIRARSADRIVPELQDLDIGEKVLDSEAGDTYFVVAEVDPPRALVLHSHTHPLPLYRDTSFSWAFVVRADDGGSRLLMRARIAYTPLWPALVVEGLIKLGFGAGDVLQAGAMLLGIKSRSERRVAERRSVTVM
jgi:hypothetical protein